MDGFEHRVEQLSASAEAQAEHLLKLIGATIEAWKGDRKFAGKVEELSSWRRNLLSWRQRLSEAKDPYGRYSLVLEFIRLCNQLEGEEWG